MPIISKVEAKSRKGRILHALIFLALTIGGLTMVYPFVLMVSGSLRSELDETDLDLVPRFLFNRDIVYRKFLETKYNQDIQSRNRTHLRQGFNFKTADVPEEVNEQRVADFYRFLEETSPPRHWQTLGGVFGIRTVPENLRGLRNRLAARYEGDIEAFNREAGAVLPSWQAVVLPPPQWQTQRYDYPDNELFYTYFAMQEEAPAAERIFISLSGYFLETMIYPVYGQLGTAAFNEGHPGIQLSHYRDFSLPRRLPPEAQPVLRAEWLEFVREEINPSFILLEGVEADEFHAYLAETYGTIGDLNYAWGRQFDSFAQIPLPSGEWLRGSFRTDYHEFLLERDPSEYLLVGPEYTWRDWLEANYGTIAAMNEAHGTSYASFDNSHLPLEQVEKSYVDSNLGSLRFQFSVRNFINVFDALFLRGRAFVNTLIFCTLSVTLSLLINPLTAYALSRFRLPGSYKILLFVMATMAFPPMVTLIPTFIILQNLGLMNTFAALVLPTIANGYLIFLLKGFFDSLPQDLYHAAMIDGASEFRIFFQITMALSKPILAVVALMAFNSAYTMFLYPLLVAPREDMWLLSVWLYQYRETASMGGVFASVLVASVPTLLIFVFCQNIIMRGIVVPVEK
jgi:ABC-type glycerol-3-phosphate transport system permease component